MNPLVTGYNILAVPFVFCLSPTCKIIIDVTQQQRYDVIAKLLYQYAAFNYMLQSTSMCHLFSVYHLLVKIIIDGNCTCVQC